VIHRSGCVYLSYICNVRRPRGFFFFFFFS